MKILTSYSETTRLGNVWSICSHLLKVAELVPVLYQTIQKIELNNVTAVIQAIDKFCIVFPDPEIYSRGLMVSTIRVAVHWHI
jgi:hypothetical protein